jgi:hypothetical protein
MKTVQLQIIIWVSKVPLRHSCYKTFLCQQGSKCGFKHDDAPPHVGREVTESLNRHYLNSWIGCFGSQAWLPGQQFSRSLSKSRGGHMKDMVYRRKQQTRDEPLLWFLKSTDRIRRKDEVVKKNQRIFFWKARKCVHRAVEVILKSGQCGITENLHSLILSN